MKKDSVPLIMAIFLVVGGLFSTMLLNNGTGITEASPAHRSAEFFISTAQGAESSAALFGARTLSSLTAVSGDGTLDIRSAFSVNLGAVENVGISWPAHVSSRRR
jgi:hypothetical protein